MALFPKFVALMSPVQQTWTPASTKTSGTAGIFKRTSPPVGVIDVEGAAPGEEISCSPSAASLGKRNSLQVGEVVEQEPVEEDIASSNFA